MADNPSEAAGLLTVDLDAIAANWRRLSSLAPCAAVVKADAYGLGMAPVSRALARAGCRTFLVATLDEGVALRPVLPDAEIAVLSAPVEGFQDVYRRERLLPVLNHPGDAAAWPDRAILHIDTGMARLGVDPAQARDFRGRDFAYVMSHLACADEPNHPLNGEQLRLFGGLRRDFDAPASLANSSGLFLGPDYRFDLARPGMALYGLNPRPGLRNPMRPVVRLQAPILQIRAAGRPLTVGYGATARVGPGRRLATVAAGYADGYPRAAGNRAQARIAGRIVPVVGRVSMDTIVLDVSDLPRGAADVGDPADLLDGAVTADDLAAAAGTIGYEVLTSLGSRYRRSHIGAGA